MGTTTPRRRTWASPRAPPHRPPACAAPACHAAAYRRGRPTATPLYLIVLLRAIRTRLRHDSPGAGPDAQLGAVSFLHRFDAALNPHFHFHLVVLDGVFTETNGEVRFHEATHFTADDARALTPVLQRRILRLFQRRGLLEAHTVDEMLTWQGTGGFSLDASVRILGSDRAGRERLLRYCVRAWPGCCCA